MQIMLEGPPRAGKSYSAVAEHILPALRAGRRVYARLNGLNFEGIAEYLQMPVERVRALLTQIPSDEVASLLIAEGDDPPQFKVEQSSLIVVDECHEFWPKSRQQLPKAQTHFFAKHGHIGLDVVLMSQAIDELHTAIVRRIERKAVYVKQNALGRPTHYTVRMYSVADKMGKFSHVASESKAYDPAIWPLYHGFQPGTENVEAYTEGTKTVWQVIRKPVIAMGLFLALGVALIGSFFRDGGGLVAEQKAAVPAVAPPPQRSVAVGASSITAQPSAQVKPAAPKAPPVPPRIQYVLDLNRTARPRLLGTFETVAAPIHVVEWRALSGHVTERMDSRQLAALGFKISREAFGIVAEASGQTIIFTMWPIDVVFGQSSRRTASIRAAGAPASR